MDYTDLKRLMIFQQVIASGSFTSAARKLGLQRSSVSAYISQLEASIGVRLIQRTTRKLSLTQEGKRILGHCEAVKQALERIDVIASSEKVDGQVAISITHDAAEFWLLPRLQTFFEQYPQIRVRIVVDDFVSDIVGDEIDLALRGTIADEPSNLIGRELGLETTRFYASPEYLNARGLPRSISDLSKHTWVLLNQAFPQQNVVLYTRKRKRLIKAQHYHETDSPSIERQMMECGMGIGIHLPSMAAQSVKQKKLVQVMPNHHSISVRFSLMYPSRVLPLRTRLLVEHLVASGWVGAA